ncbi:MAG: outer membrane beta-barrel protein [Chitinophagaceae bacterium]
MKKIVLFLAGGLLLSSAILAQDTLNVVPKKKKTINLANRANDHFMIQLGYAGLGGKPDTIQTGGISKVLNFYFMFDFPFKTNPKLSMAFGPGISSDQIGLNKTFVGIKENTTQLAFTNQADTNHFKRVKLAMTYAELPVEFRYTGDPMNAGKSFKAAVGLRVGTMLNAHTKNRTLQNSSGNTLNDFTLKESSKKFFNSTRLSAIARVGWGHFTIFGSYQITSLFKEGVAAEMHPYSIGLNLSGL